MMHHNFTKWVFTACFLFTLLHVKGQYTANKYDFYTGTGATALAPTFTNAINSGQNDVASAVITIPFTFKYENVNYTQVTVSSNGLIRFGSTVVSTSNTNNITAASDQPKLMPLWDDFSTGTTGSVRYGTRGAATAGNRVFVLDFNLNSTNSTAAAFNIRFQVLLHESVNVIQFIYIGTGTAVPSASCGIGGLTESNYMSINTSTHASSNSSATNSNTTWPGDGRFYMFVPVAPMSELGFETANASEAVTSSPYGAYVPSWLLLLGLNNSASSSSYIAENINYKSSTSCAIDQTLTSSTVHGCHNATGGLVRSHAQASEREHHGIVNINTSMSIPHKDAGAYGPTIGNCPLPTSEATNLKCIRLGGEQEADSRASGMRSTFYVDKKYLVVHYWLFLAASGHTANYATPFASIQVKDLAGKSVSCIPRTIIENDAVEGNMTPTRSMALYGDHWGDAGKPYYIMYAWRTRIYDMTNFMGQNLSMEIWVADCAGDASPAAGSGSHPGWGFFDFEAIDVITSGRTPECIVLPIELTSFDATCDDKNEVKLQWTTASETNNDYFTVEGSMDGQDFYPLGKVQGAGNATRQNTYAYSTQIPVTNTMYYRLKQTDYDGKFTYSNVIAPACEETQPEDGMVTVFADLPHGQLNVGFEKPMEGKFLVNLVSMDGKVIFQEGKTIHDARSLSLQTGELAAGIYVLNLYSNSKVVSKKFVVSK